jgi:excisionase family DNA binding protein
MQQTELITSTQAGQILGVSGRTVVRWSEDGRIEVAQRLTGPNGAMLFRRSDVQALADSRAAEAASGVTS